jgi:hypothetical protein
MTLATDTPASIAGTPLWLWTAGGGGLAWNAYGVVQFAQSVRSTPVSLMAMGLDPAQAMTMTMTSYPLWMTAAFAVGVFGGLVGSALLLLRRRQAVGVFVASLIAYVALYIGDITEGVFAAMGASQVVVLTLVVLIAAGLLWAARRASARGLLA